MNDRQAVLERGVTSLTHPLSVAAIILLLVNDHWLRWRYPSRWTGKIGDFAWLIFAPFIVILVLSGLMPQKTGRHIGLTAFVGTGLVFILGNTSEGFYHIITRLFYLIAGWQPFLHRDPTDLLMLPGLIVGWRIWQKSKKQKQRYLFASHKRTISWFVFTLGVLATLANQPSFSDYGVYCVIQQGNSLIAFTGSEYESRYGWFESTTGGLTWVKLAVANTDDKPTCQREFPPWQLTDQADTNIRWRITAAEKYIEHSFDAGKTWRKIYRFPAGEQVREYYYRPYPQDIGPQGAIIKPGGPYNGVVDESTGNLIVSMGFEGVVVVTPEGEGRRVNVGPYAFIDIRHLPLQERLHDELFFAVYLAFLAISILSIPLWPPSRARSLFIGGVFIGALFWLLLALFVNVTFYVYLLQELLIFIKGWLIYPVLAIIAAVKIFQRQGSQLIAVVLTTTLTSVALFLLPLLFWATGSIPAYPLAMSLGILMASLPIRYAYRRLNVRQNK